jgi:hypothetical protein
MDYRFYRGDGPKIPPRFTKYIHLLRYIGIAMLVSGVLIPWLIVLKYIESTLGWNYLSAGFSVLGGIVYFIGYVFNNLIDRG